MHDAEQEARQHQAHGDFGIEAGAAIVGATKLGHVSAKPPKVENLIDLHPHMVIGDQTPQRPGDDKPGCPRSFRPGIAALIHRHAKLIGGMGLFQQPQLDQFLTLLTPAISLPAAAS